MSIQDDDEYVIAAPGRLSLNLEELWHFRELFYFFTWRDVKVKYKQTVLGIFWAVLQPLFMMIVFTFLFGRTLGIQTNGIPYPLFVFSGLVLWNMFSTGLTNAGNSMVSNANIIKKIYFPRLIIPVSAMLSSLFDFLFAFIIFIGMVVWYAPEIGILRALWCWPLGILLACMATLGPGCLLCALNIKYRDFRYVIPFIVQALLFLTPVIYPLDIVSKPWIKVVLALNPMFGAIEIFRIPFTGVVTNPLLTGMSVISGAVFLLAGLLYFKRTEVYFADFA